MPYKAQGWSGTHERRGVYEGPGECANASHARTGVCFALPLGGAGLADSCGLGVGRLARVPVGERAEGGGVCVRAGLLGFRGASSSAVLREQMRGVDNPYKRDP